MEKLPTCGQDLNHINQVKKPLKASKCCHNLHSHVMS